MDDETAQRALAVLYASDEEDEGAVDDFLDSHGYNFLDLEAWTRDAMESGEIDLEYYDFCMLFGY